MHRTDGANNESGQFVTGAVVTSDWLNAIQEELATVIEDGGGASLNKANNGHLLAAIQTILLQYGQMTPTAWIDKFSALNTLKAKAFFLDKDTGIIEVATTLGFRPANLGIVLAGYLLYGTTGSHDRERFIFAVELVADLSATLSGSHYMCGFCSAVSGYIAGAFVTATSQHSGIISKMPFATEEIIESIASLSVARSGAGKINSGLAAYIMGGTNNSNFVENTIDKFVFSAETATAFGSSLPSSRCAAAGFNLGAKGYLAGGWTGSFIAQILRMLFSTEALSAITSALTIARDHSSAVSSASAGYVCEGSYGSANRIIDKMIGSTETVTNLATYTGARYDCHGINSAIAGYIAGGWDGTTDIKTITKIAFATDTISTLSAQLVNARSRGASFQSGWY